MNPVLVDTNVLLDLATNDATWCGPSTEALRHAAETSVLVINPIIFAEFSMAFERIEEMDTAIPVTAFRRDRLPSEAGFLAGKCFLRYRRLGGARTSPLPDFYIGAHAATAGFLLLTRDVARYRTYFPTVELIVPKRR